MGLLNIIRELGSAKSPKLVVADAYPNPVAPSDINVALTLFTKLSDASFPRFEGVEGLLVENGQNIRVGDTYFSPTHDLSFARLQDEDVSFIFSCSAGTLDDPDTISAALAHHIGNFEETKLGLTASYQGRALAGLETTGLHENGRNYIMLQMLAQT